MDKLPFYKRAKVADLVPSARNARMHSTAQVAQIANSIKEFGFLNPVITDGANGIIAGHGRIMAAQMLGLDEVPIVEAGHLSESQRRAFAIVDNKLALNAEWDTAMLRMELEGLGELGFDIALTGFNYAEVSDIFAEHESVAMPILRDGEKAPFQQIAFTLHDEQSTVVVDALKLARNDPLADTGLNENTNGNALTLICGEYLEDHGNS